MYDKSLILKSFPIYLFTVLLRLIKYGYMKKKFLFELKAWMSFNCLSAVLIILNSLFVVLMRVWVISIKMYNRWLKIKYPLSYFSFDLPACLLTQTIFFLNSDSFTSVNVRWNGTNINFVNVSLSQIPGSRDLSGSAVVVHNATGNDEFCLALVIG